MTPNKARGEVLCEMKEFSVILRPTFQAACKIESDTGLSLTQLAQRLANAEAIGVGIFSAIIFHGAQAAGETRKRDQIGDAVVRTGLGKLTPPVLNYVTAFLMGDTNDGDTESGEADAPADK